MPDLLLELGCEELPASFVRRAFAELQGAISKRLSDAGISFKPEEAMGTPRRLIVHFKDLPEKQPSRTEEKRGPSESAAFDASGKPTPALLGFCKAMGVDPSQVRKEGGYAWATKAIPGRQTVEVLAEILPDAIRSLTFDKAMRWGASRMRFARPIRWILAAFHGKAIPFELQGVKAGLKSRGHRFAFPDEFEAKTFDELLKGLRKRAVEPEHEERKKQIVGGATNATSGTPDLKDALVEENVFLVEQVNALEGHFDERFLELPAPVLTTVMAKHERFIPVRGKDGKLTNRFISIWNGGDETTVRAGNEWVLNARFNDAQFFFEQDKAHSLKAFLERTSGIVFQEKLGTIRSRSERLEKLAAEVARITGANDAEQKLAAQAGLFAKADLSSGLVSELASLQGVVGGEYARRENFPDPVCWAIASHYDLDANREIECEGARTAIRALIADQIDKLVGYLGIGLAPSGSSDPYGLRRAATMLIEAAWRWPAAAPLYSNELIDFSAGRYKSQGIELDRQKILSAMKSLFFSRYESLLPDVRRDYFEAIANWSLLPRDVRIRIEVLKLLAPDKGFVQTATRPINILAAAIEKGQYQASPEAKTSLKELGAMDSKEGEKLADLTIKAMPELEDASHKEDPQSSAKILKSLEKPINEFFESTMVMAESPELRRARLAVVELAAKALSFGGNFSKIVIEGV